MNKAAEKIKTNRRPATQAAHPECMVSQHPKNNHPTPGSSTGTKFTSVDCLGTALVTNKNAEQALGKLCGLNARPGGRSGRQRKNRATVSGKNSEVLVRGKVQHIYHRPTAHNNNLQRVISW